jgi:hypothetical protein
MSIVGFLFFDGSQSFNEKIIASWQVWFKVIPVSKRVADGCITA